MAAKADAQQYLTTDTHWTPAGMSLVAQKVADTIRDLVPVDNPIEFTTETTDKTQFGDIATMLKKLPSWQGTISKRPPPSPACSTPMATPGRPPGSAGSQVLLLGDSFTNIYHLEPMGWGDAAGLAQHMSLNLQQPIDVLARNDAGAFASRQMLLDALAVDPHRLAHTKVVVWEFAERELALGDWKLLELPEEPADPPPPLPSATPDGVVVASVADAPAAFAEMVTQAGDKPAIIGNDEWIHLTAEMRSLDAPFWGEHAKDPIKDPLATIIDFHEKLAQLDIELVLAPAPPRAVIYPETLFAEVPRDDNGIPLRLDPHFQQFYDELRAAGVTVIDSTDAYLAARTTEATDGVLVCEQDTHWAPRGLQITADLVFEHLAELEFDDLPDEKWGAYVEQDPEALTYQGDLVDRVEGLTVTSSDAIITRVTDDEAGKQPLSFDPESPILLLADSHGLVFSTGDDMHSTGSWFWRASQC